MTTSLFASFITNTPQGKCKGHSSSEERKRELGTRKQLIVSGLGINKEEEDRRAGKEVSSSQLL